MFLPFIIDILTVCSFVACLHWHYGNWKKHQIIVTIVTFIAWYFPFMIIFVMPIDVSMRSYKQCLHDHYPPVSTTSSHFYSTTSSHDNLDDDASLLTNLNSNDVSTIMNTTMITSMITHSKTNITNNEDFVYCTKPISFVPDPTLSIFWHIVYWTSQSLTWIILPLMQTYSKAGEFTILGKMRYTLLVNAIYYGTYLVIFACCLIYLAATGILRFEIAQLKVLAITASNTWGLTLLVLLLGYGLVEVPRFCWNNSKNDFMLARVKFKVAKLSIDKIEAEEELEDVIAETKKIIEATGPESPLWKNINIIINKLPEAFSNVSSTRATFDRTLENHISEKALVKLHRRLIVAIQHNSCTRCVWNSAVEEAIMLNDVEENVASGVKQFRRSIGPYDGLFKSCYSARLEWYWKCHLKPYIMKFLAITMATFSIALVWSECLFFIKQPTLSIFALLIQISSENYFALAIVSVLTISYMSICTYYTIFKLRIFNYYSIVGPHETDENSMIFCGMLLCRLTPPLCLNFLGLIHLDSHITKDPNIVETAYTGFMGHMDILPFISDGFNIYFPIAIVVLCALTFFGVGTRVLHCLGFQQFIGEDNMTQEMIDEGAELVRRELRKRGRQEDLDTRRRIRDDRKTDDSIKINTSTPRNKPGHDRAELLSDAEPMGYRSNDDPNMSSDHIQGLYQSDGVSRPQFYSDQQGFGSTSVRPTSKRVSQNIFDDV